MEPSLNKYVSKHSFDEFLVRLTVVRHNEIRMADPECRTVLVVLRLWNLRNHLRVLGETRAQVVCVLQVVAGLSPR